MSSLSKYRIVINEGALDEDNGSINYFIQKLENVYMHKDKKDTLDIGDNYIEGNISNSVIFWSDVGKIIKAYTTENDIILVDISIKDNTVILTFDTYHCLHTLKSS